MTKRILYILLLSPLLFCTGSVAQGIHWSYYIIDQPFSNYELFETPYTFGFGYDQNIGTKNAASLDINFNAEDYGAGTDNITTLNDYNATYAYSVIASITEVSYQSKYLFNGNTEKSAFVSAGLAYKMISYEWTIDAPFAYNANLPASVPPGFQTGTFKENLILLPLTLRLGYRGTLYHGYGEYSIGVRYNMGANQVLEDPTYKYVDSGAPHPANLNFVLSMSWGFGWADE